MRLYLDRDSEHAAVLLALRADGHDVLTTTAAGNSRASDESQLLFAFEQSRVVYTGNVGDYARLHRDWLASGRHHAGIIAWVQRKDGIPAQVRILRRILATFDQDDFRDRMEYAGAYR